MKGSSAVKLPSGRKLEYKIKSSARAKHLRLKMTIREGLTVVVPKGMSENEVNEIVTGKRLWISNQLDKFDEVRHLIVDEADSACPEAVDLPAVSESWRIEYRSTKAKTVGARTDRDGRIVVYGAITDKKRCKAALRRWLARRAKEHLSHLLESFADTTGLHYSRLTIKNQRTRWGSCSAKKAINLNCKLLFLPPESVRYVILHELCHTIELNHSKRFWAHLRQLEPQTDLLHGYMRDAWKRIPAWAHPMKPHIDSL